MAEEEGLVASTGENGWAQVIAERRDACGDCGASHSHCCASFGGSSKMVIKAMNRAGAGVGDLVSFSLKSGTVVQSAAIFYLIPLIGLIFGAAIGTTSSLGLPISETAGGILFSFAGLALGFLITALITRWLSAKQAFTPVITRVIKSGFRAPESLIAIDPVCKMAVDPQEAPASFVYQNKTYYFCHPGCKESFERKPDKYL
jgi:positive regulator of sigma E activity/YHS domain-containing protein